MRVLVVRPSEQAARTAQKLTALGHQPFLAPVMEIAPTGAEIPNIAVDLVLATSARAFSGFVLSSALLALPLHCVGEKTAQAGQEAGFSAPESAENSQALAAALLKSGQVKSALYLAGRERKPELEALLRQAGWRLEIVETYAAQPVAALPETVKSALAAGEIDAVLHYSPRSAVLFAALAGPAAVRAAHYCLSAEVAKALLRALPDAPPAKIAVASHPNEETLLSLLQAGAGAGARERPHE
jgi:uroporphyrinogen-III synthase